MKRNIRTWGRRTVSRPAAGRSGAVRLEALESRTLFDGAPIDAAFGDGGRAKFDVAGLEDRTTFVHVLPSGKILVAGNAVFAITTNLPAEWAGMESPPVQSVSRGFVARLNADGSLDATFGDNGIAPQSSDPYTWVSNDQAPDVPFVRDLQSMAVGPDGAIYLGGAGYAYYPYTGPQPTGAGVQPIHFAADRAFAVVAYNADGSRRTTFGKNGVALADMRREASGGGNEVVMGLTVQPDGKPIAVGRVEKQQRDGGDPESRAWDQSDMGVVRFNADGSVDSSFGKQVEDFPRYAPGLPRMELARAVAVQPDGKVVVAGTTSARDGVGGGWALVRYNPDGTRDASFGDDGHLIATGFAAPDPSDGQNALGYSEAERLLVQPDGKIVAFGGLDVSYIAMMRFTPDGALDASFGDGGRVTARGVDGHGYQVGLRDDGSITVAGVGMGSDWVWIDKSKNTMTSVQTGHEAYTGTFDSTGRRVSSARAVHLPVVANDNVWQAAVTPDGKIVGVGIAYPTAPSANPMYGNTADALVMRFDPSQFSPDGPDSRDAGGGGTATPAFSGKATVRAGKANTFGLTFASEAAARQAAVSVTGPDGTATPAQLVKVKFLRGGRGGGRPSATFSRLVVGATRPVVATYRVAAPGGRYDAADNGAYAVRVAPSGDPAAAATAGQFTVASRVGAAAGGASARRATEVLREGEDAGVR